jgi:hypothetical protein
MEATDQQHSGSGVNGAASPHPANSTETPYYDALPAEAYDTGRAADYEQPSGRQSSHPSAAQSTPDRTPPSQASGNAPPPAGTDPAGGRQASNVAPPHVNGEAGNGTASNSQASSDVPPQADLDQQPPKNLVAWHYPGLEGALSACTAVFGAMALAGRTKPLSLIFETGSGYGKTAVLQMAFPLRGVSIPTCDSLDQYVYRSDKFTPKAFVSHAANVKRANLAAVDLLPRLQRKVLITKELAPIFRGREEELKENFSILISVLDGKGFTSDSGTHGQRGYQESILFNWIGATTPLPASTHRLMSQLGTRLLFYEVPAIAPNTQDLLAYAEKDQAETAEKECQRAVNEFLVEFFKRHPVGSVPVDSIVFPKPLLSLLVQLAEFLAAARAEVCFERIGTNWEPVAAMQPEGPWKIVDYFKELARGHALIHGRTTSDQSDLDLVGRVAISSIPGHLRPIVRGLMARGCVDTPAVTALCRVTYPTARSYLRQLELLGIVQLTKGAPESNQPDTAALASAFAWLRAPFGSGP